MPRADEIPRRLLVAIGGNAIHPENIRGTSAEQKAIAETTAQALLPLAQIDTELVIAHGNGPVVGKILMRQALTRARIAIRFLEGGGERVIVGHLDQAMAALRGETGTHVVLDDA